MPKYIIGFFAVLVIMVMSLPLDAKAGIYKGNFRNDYQADSIYLFLYDEAPDADVIFQNVRLNPASAWSAAAQTETYLWLSGPAVSPKSVKFNLTFTDDRATRDILPFTLEWAEYLNGSFAAPDAFGSLMRGPRQNGAGYQWTASDAFSSPVPTPLPASTWLLLSGLFF